jgi:hypothetical protein
VLAQSPSALADFDAATTYSYDIHGNVDTLVQQYRKGMMASHGDNRFKVMTYQYDLISGKVNQVHYQPGEPDQYYHRYAYDAENRITDVYTTTNKALIGSDVLEDHEAFYSYYTHGPLARTILGQQQVQGVDYAYTLQGWLKGVNSMALDTAIDMGRDGGGTITARDAYGFQLNYFTGDYKPVNTSRNPFPGHSGYIGAAYRPLYNGNISSMGVNIGKLNQPQLYNYEYDQLNRLVSMQAYRGFSGNSWSGITATTDHQEQITYDGNGNITSYLRNGNTSAGKPLAMDNLGYAYNKDGSGNLINNKLRHVTDAVTAVANYTEDIDGQVADNYSYDQIGNLTGDIKEKIDSIEWNVYGKIAQIWKDNSPSVGDLQRIAYRYDASGNRISKTVYSNQDATNYKALHTWYVRDASGNVMATYTSEDVAAKSTLATGTLGKLYLNELHMYGSSRLGIWSRKVDMDVLPASGGTAPLLGTLGIDTFNRGNKFFELANHLGNVLVTVSDRKVGQNPASGLYTSYTSEVVSASDYAPFGMQMVGRTFEVAGSTTYRFSINGQEKTPEIAPNTTTAEYWQYDARIARRWNTDPLVKVHESSYATFANNPINYIDPNGADTINITRTTTRRLGGKMGGGLDGVSSKIIPDEITRTASVGVIAAKGEDIFRITDINVTIGVDGTETRISSTTTLNLNNEQTFYRTGGHNMKGYLDDRYALAANAPTWLLQYYAEKSNDIGIKSAIAYQKDIRFAAGVEKVMDVAYTLSGAYGVFRFGVSRLAYSSYINLASNQRTIHILAGDVTGGGHSWFGSLGSFTNGLKGVKSMFPVNWSKNKIMHAISDVAVNNPWVQQTGKAGALFTKSGQPVRYAVEGTYQGVKIKVITTADDIITAYPIK